MQRLQGMQIGLKIFLYGILVGRSPVYSTIASVRHSTFQPRFQEGLMSTSDIDELMAEVLAR